MKRYEGMFIIKPDITPDAQAKVVELIKATITKNGGTIIVAEGWGKRKLTHEIEKFKEGEYHRVEFEIEPKAILDLKQAYKLNEDIIREIITVKE